MAQALEIVAVVIGYLAIGTVFSGLAKRWDWPVAKFDREGSETTRLLDAALLWPFFALFMTMFAAIRMIVNVAHHIGTSKEDDDGAV